MRALLNAALQKGVGLSYWSQTYALRMYLSLCDGKAREKQPRYALERSEIVSALLDQ